MAERVLTLRELSRATRELARAPGPVRRELEDEAARREAFLAD